jgi:mono/diheme cytochrome c family protein
MKWIALALALCGCTQQAPAPQTCPTGGPVHAAASASAAPSAQPAVDPRDDRAQLQFFNAGKLVRALTKETLRTTLPIETFTIPEDKEYDGKKKIWRTVPTRGVLEAGFAGTGLDLAQQQFVLRCLDGYTVPVDGKRLLDDGGAIAIADAEVPGWELVGPRQVNPGPYFMVWKKPEQQNGDAYPRPYQLAAIEIATFESTFPHVIPSGEKEGSPALHGLALFREQCIRCHSINQEGGKVGPDLNVPQSVVEYRAEAQIKAYIADPRTFRYGTMPAHPHFKPADLDALVAYFRAMSKQKHDPSAPKPKEPAPPKK